MTFISGLWLFFGAFVFPVAFSFALAFVIQSSEHAESIQAWFYPGLILGVTVGAVCVLFLPIRAPWAKYSAVVAYFPLMLWIAWMVGMYYHYS